MMTIWFAVIALSLAIAAVFWWGSTALSRSDSKASNAQSAALFEARIAEIKQDVASDILSESEARAQEAEVARRILASVPQGVIAGNERSSKLNFSLVLLVPLLAVAIYAKVGFPQMPDVPQAERLQAAETNGDLPAMIYKVESHLAKNPDDVTGWQLLVPNYMAAGRFGDVALAQKRIIEISGPSPDRNADFAEALMMRDEGTLSKEAVAAVNAALAIDPKHSKARFYAAMALHQSGKPEEALMKYQELLRDTSADAPWRGAIERAINALVVAKAQPPKLTEEQLAGGAELQGDDQAEMIKGMVDGLAAKLAENPKDLVGSLRLIRARMVLKQVDLAKENLATARATFVGDASALNDINTLAKELSLP